jgi:hypothetical protein
MIVDQAKGSLRDLRAHSIHYQTQNLKNSNFDTPWGSSHFVKILDLISSAFLSNSTRGCPNKLLAFQNLEHVPVADVDVRPV